MLNGAGWAPLCVVELASFAAVSRLGDLVELVSLMSVARPVNMPHLSFTITRVLEAIDNFNGQYRGA
jgi:hypothetical protein